MQIPIKPNKSLLELVSIKLYSTGLKKVYTSHFYKSMNHNFGVEITIRNNTTKTLYMKIGGCIYDNKGESLIKWNKSKEINAKATTSYDFYVREEQFLKMKEGKYKIQFWINDKKVQKEIFTITYK